MPRLSWTAPARNDLRAIDDWVTSRAAPAVAVRTLAAIREKADLLTRFPEIGRAVPKLDARILLVTNTGYLVVYRADADRIEVLRIRHEREDWRD